MSREYCLHWRYANWVHLLAKVKRPPMPNSLTRNVLWDICDKRWSELHSGAASVSQVSKDRFNTEPVEMYRLAECVSTVVPCSVWSHVAMIQLSGILILAENQRLLVIPLVQQRKKKYHRAGKSLERWPHRGFPREELPDYCHMDKSDYFGVINSFFNIPFECILFSWHYARCG